MGDPHRSRTTRLEISFALIDLGREASAAGPILRLQLPKIDDYERKLAKEALQSFSYVRAREQAPTPPIAPVTVAADADIATARSFVRARLEEARLKGQQQAGDPYWRSSGRNVQRHVARAYGVALVVLAERPPHSGETKEHDFARVAEAIREKRSSEPDADDEGWFSSAIDEAAAIVLSASSGRTDTRPST